MKKNDNILLILMLVLFAFGLGLFIGYNLNKNNMLQAVENKLDEEERNESKTKVTKVAWDIHFENPQTVTGSVACSPTLSDSATLTYNPTLANPGDYCEFTVDVKNGGTVPAKLSADSSGFNLTNAQAAYLNYSATYSDGSTIAANDTLSVGEKKKLKIRIEYKSDVDAGFLSIENINVTISFSMNYIQA